MEAFLAIHSHLELPTGCQGDGPRGGLSKAGWKFVYFIQRDCVTRRNEAEPQKPRVNTSNQVYTVGDTAEHFQNRDMILQQVITRKWPRLPEPKIINSFFFFFMSLLNLLQNCFCFMLFFFFSCRACGIFTASTRDWTHSPYSGSAESEPLDRQGSKIKMMNT